MERRQVEFVATAFVVVVGKRKCLICENVFTPAGAAEHAKVMLPSTG